MLSSNTETLITATYQDSDGTIDLVVDNNLANYSNATSGFLTSETSHADVVVDGDFASQGIMLRGAGAGTYSILTDSSANWNTAFGWGNHASGGYLTSIAANSINDTHIDWGTGSNQVSTADIPEATNLYYTDVRADARITNAGSANWNTAYGWGNHASGGYLTNTGVLSSHTDVHNAAPIDGQVLTWVNANSRWEASAASAGIALTDLSVGSEGSASGDGSIAYNNGTGVFTYTPPTASGIGAGTMSNVVEDTSPQLGGYLDAQTNKITNVGKLQLVDGLDDSVLEIDVGYARQSTWALTGSTSGTTPTEIFVGGAASRRVLPADYNDVAMFEISVVAVDTNTLANSAAWKFIGFGFNNAGTLALIGNITEEEINAQTGWSVVIGVTSTDLTITVTADAGSAVKWAAFAKCTQAQSS